MAIRNSVLKLKMFSLGRKITVGLNVKTLARFYCEKPPDPKNIKLEKIIRRSKMSPSARLESLLPPKPAPSNDDDSKIVLNETKCDDPKTVSDDNKSEDCEVFVPKTDKSEDKETPVFVKINKTKLPPRFLRRKSLSPWARLEALTKDDESKKD